LKSAVLVVELLENNTLFVKLEIRRGNRRLQIGNRMVKVLDSPLRGGGPSDELLVVRFDRDWRI
jgi:hypothetical protein